MSDSSFTPLTPSLLETAIGTADEMRGEAAGETRTQDSTRSTSTAFTGWKDLTARLIGDPEDKWKEAGSQLSAYIRENPGKTLLAGVGTGFLIGLLFPRK